MNAGTSQQSWIERAEVVLPAGGFGNFETDIVLRNGKGARVWDEDGNEYVDLLIGSGPMIIGHGHPEVLEVVQKQITDGMTFFANNARGIELAEEICSAVACAEQVRYVSSGGEADMYAMRLARAHTGRDKILKFEGGYHGMSAESLMSLAPTRLENYPIAVPDSAGIPDCVRDQMIIAPFNDIEAVRQLLDENEGEVAAIIVEPLQRLIPQTPGFLQALREETKKRDIVLIFDEVVTGFRLAYGGAQEAYGVTPDLCTLGKIIGGGFPLAAIAGSKDIMAHFDKSKVGEEGFTFQVGTLSGNPVAAAAGLKTMEILRRPGMYEQIFANGEAIQNSLRTHLDKTGIAYQIVGERVMFDTVFTENAVTNYRAGLNANSEINQHFNKVQRSCGVLKSVGKTYVSHALTSDDLSQIDNAIAQAASAIS